MEHASDLFDEKPHGHGDGAHASVLFYNIIAALLFFITFCEVAVLYPPMNGFGEYFKVILLVVLSIAKFAAVVAFFMHLFFDASLCTFLFATGLVIGGGTVVALIHVMPAAEHPLQPTGKRHHQAEPEESASPAAPGEHASTWEQFQAWQRRLG